MAAAAPDLEGLARRYEHLADVVRRGGRAYPAAVEPGRPAGREGLVVIEDDEVSVDEALERLGAPHVDRLRAAAPGLHDGPVLALREVEDGRLRVGRGRYLAMLATCDVLRAEVLEASPALPARVRAERAAGPDPLRRGRGRVAAVGVSVLMVVAGATGPAAVLGRRRRDLAADPGAWHVVPSGMLEPAASDGDPVLETVRGELTEELGLRLSAADLRRRLRPLGIGYDLLRLRPEVCLTLDLADVNATALRLGAEEYEALRIAPLDGGAGLWPRRPLELTPAAAAALALFERRS